MIRGSLAEYSIIRICSAEIVIEVGSCRASPITYSYRGKWFGHDDVLMKNSRFGVNNGDKVSCIIDP